jgi:hypothetical protein
MPIKMEYTLYEEMPRKVERKVPKIANWDRSTKINGNSLVKDEKISETHTAPMDH